MYMYVYICIYIYIYIYVYIKCQLVINIIMKKKNFFSIRLSENGNHGFIKTTC